MQLPWRLFLFFLFLGVVVLLLRRGWKLIAPLLPSRARLPLGVLYALLPFSLFGARALPPDCPWVPDLLYSIGGFWMVAFGVALPFGFLAEFANMFRRGAAAGPWPVRVSRGWAALFAFTALLFCVGGFWHAQSLQVVRYSLALEKPLDRPLRIALFSDIHFDPLTREARISRLVDSIARYNPDLVLFAGDLNDLDTVALHERGIGESLRRLDPPLGFFGSTGNHEFYVRTEESLPYASARGIRWLRDQTLCLEQRLCLTGREDLQAAGHGGEAFRASLRELKPAGTDTLPWLVLDHQPQDFVLEEAAAAGVDLLVSGHTHAGQFWPWTHVVDLLYPNAYGLRKLSELTANAQARGWSLVSAGAGTWGPPVRIGTTGEVVILDLR